MSPRTRSWRLFTVDLTAIGFRSRIEVHGWVTTAVIGATRRSRICPQRTGSCLTHPTGSSHHPVRARGRLRPDRSHRLGVPVSQPLRHRLSLHDRRRMVQPAAPLPQQPIRLRPGRALLELYIPPIFSREPRFAADVGSRAPISRRSTRSTITSPATHSYSPTTRTPRLASWAAFSSTSTT